MKVLGIDPGLATIGIGLIEKSEAPARLRHSGGRNPRPTRSTAIGRAAAGRAKSPAPSSPFPKELEVRGAAEGLHFVDFCTIETSPALSTPERLAELARDLRNLLEEHRPALAVVEKLYFETNRKTAMQVAEARGVILLTLQQNDIPVLEPTPLELKLAITGDGQADKEQLRKMLVQTLRVDAETFQGFPDDATDAVALAVYGALYQSKLGTGRALSTAGNA